MLDGQATPEPPKAPVLYQAPWRLPPPPPFFFPLTIHPSIPSHGWSEDRTRWLPAILLLALEGMADPVPSKSCRVEPT